MRTMLAAVLHNFNDLRLEEIPIPEPRQPGDVLVKVKACGVCATDYKAIKGIRRNVTFPSIQGHEPSGIVAEVGPGVAHVKVGDEVIVQPLGHCGFCAAAGWATPTTASMHSSSAATARTMSGRARSRSIMLDARSARSIPSRRASRGMRPPSPSRWPARGRA